MLHVFAETRIDEVGDQEYTAATHSALSAMTRRDITVSGIGLCVNEGT
jgi:hypothetical protein